MTTPQPPQNPYWNAAPQPTPQPIAPPPFGAASQPTLGSYAAPGGFPTGATAGGTTVLPPPRKPKQKSMKLRIAALAAACSLVGGAVGATTVSLTGADSSAAISTSTTSTAGTTANGVQAVASKALPSVVEIGVQSSQGSGIGSGVVLTADGDILTNYHVVAAAGSGQSKIQIALSDGTTYDATVVGTDPSSDLAVLHAEGASGLTPATFADSSKTQVGDEVVAIGAPAGLENTVTSGIVSYIGRQVSTQSAETGGKKVTYDAIQTDASINPGNSGGPLLNSAGEVIGINSVIYSPATDQSSAGSVGLGFAIPSNTATEIAQKLLNS